MKTLLFKPFERYNSAVLVGIGLVGIVLSALFAFWFHMRYDGVLDAHFVSSPSLKEVITDIVINVVTLFLFLFPVGLIVNRKTRYIDIFSTILISRVPLCIIPVMNLNHNLIPDVDPNDLEAITAFALNNIVQLVLMSIVLITLLVWSVALLYNGYKTACHAKGSTPVLLFIVALLLAEIASKVLIHYLN